MNEQILNQTDPMTSARYSQESLLEDSLVSAVGPFWQTRQEGYIQGQDQTNIFWVSMTNPEHTKAIVVVNGRIESAWKYQELFFELYQQGYDVYSFDHRGQGLSDRLHPDPHLGHVVNFEDYVLDMARVVAHFDLSHYQSRHLFAHSMGGAIATRYLQTQTHAFDALVLSAPMFGISMSWFLKPIAYKLAKLCSHFSKIPNYAPGQTRYEKKPFQNNNLTQSLQRYRLFRRLYEKMPELQLGGPSNHWVSEALKATHLCIQDAQKLTIPLLLMQAGDDTIVDNQAQNQFIRQFKPDAKVRLTTLAGSRHEILFETDDIRDKALDLMFEFLNQNANTCSSEKEES